MRTNPEIFGTDFRVTIIVEPERYAIRYTQGRASSKLPQGYVARLRLSPGGATGRRSSPRANRMTATWRLVDSALELSPWARPLTLWGTLDPGPSRRVPRPCLSLDRSYVPRSGHVLRRPLACALDRPQRRRRRWPNSRVATTIA